MKAVGRLGGLGSLLPKTKEKQLEIERNAIDACGKKILPNAQATFTVGSILLNLRQMFLMADSLPNENSPESVPPKAVVSRMSLYLRELQHFIRDGKETTSSTKLGERLGVTDAQVRKDLAYFGQFGYPGIGYRCQELVDEIKSILGTDRDWRVAIVGLGNLGTALLGHRGFERQGFHVIAGFDVDQRKIGNRILDVPIHGFAELAEVVKRERIKLGIIAVPAPEAQNAVDQLVGAGVVGILNFAPVTISLPSHVSLVAVDLAIELEQLSFAVVNLPENT